jgi:hypothetical protein
MDKTFIMRELTSIYREVFNDAELELTAETSAKDIPAWDSVINVTLLIAQLVAARSSVSRDQ